MSEDPKFHLGHAAFYPAIGITPNHIREASNIPAPSSAELRNDLRERVTDLERRLTAALTTNAGLLAAQKEAIDAMDDVLTSTVDASTYPDGPCIEKEFRDALRQAMKRLQAIHLSLAVEQLSGADRNLPGTTEVKQPQREPTYGPPPKGLWEREAAEAEAVKKFFK